MKKPSAISRQHSAPDRMRATNLPVVVSDFQGGMSMYQVATKWGLRTATVEQAIRNAMRPVRF